MVGWLVCCTVRVLTVSFKGRSKVAGPLVPEGPTCAAELDPSKLP